MMVGGTLKTSNSHTDRPPTKTGIRYSIIPIMESDNQIIAKNG